MSASKKTSSRAAKTKTIEIGDSSVAPGENAIVDLPIADLYTHTRLSLPVHVINGRRPGPTLVVTAAIHGDELNGVDIIRRLLKIGELKRIRGQLIAVPVVNVFGFINRSRYLPDRRDLNRSFPGREKGSVAARLAHLVATEIIEKADVGIDLHTGGADRSNLPQIRCDISDPELVGLAKAFETPVIVGSELRDGSLREFASSSGIPMLLYEAGEALRFDELSIRAGVRGIRRVMRALGMLPERRRRRRLEPVICRSTTWIRAPGSGVVLARCRLGQHVEDDQVLATIGDPFGETQTEVRAPARGIVIGRSMLPLAHEGDALFHIGHYDVSVDAAATLEEFQQTHSVDDSWG